MSTLAENVQKVVQAHAGLKTALESKGVEVPEGTKLSEMPALVSGMEIPEVQTLKFNGAKFAVSDEVDTLDCTKPILIKIDGLATCASLFSGCKARHITLPELPLGTTSTTFMFQDCSNLVSVSLPSGFGADIKTGTNMAMVFNECTSLESVSLPSGFGSGLVSGTLTKMFNGCTSLKTVTFNGDMFASLTGELNEQSTFYGCTSLESVTFPQNVTYTIRTMWQTFYDCRNLKTIGFPSGENFCEIQSFNDCFWNCRSLENISGNLRIDLDSGGRAPDISMCTKLTHDSLMVVINGLQTVTESQTLTLGATNLAKLTDEEKAIATGKGWTLA